MFLLKPFSKSRTWLSNWTELNWLTDWRKVRFSASLPSILMSFSNSEMYQDPRKFLPQFSRLFGGTEGAPMWLEGRLKGVSHSCLYIECLQFLPTLYTYLRLLENAVIKILKYFYHLSATTPWFYHCPKSSQV